MRSRSEDLIANDFKNFVNNMVEEIPYSNKKFWKLVFVIKLKSDFQLFQNAVNTTIDNNAISDFDNHHLTSVFIELEDFFEYIHRIVPRRAVG